MLSYGDCGEGLEEEDLLVTNSDVHIGQPLDRNLQSEVFEERITNWNGCRTYTFDHVHKFVLPYRGG